MPPVISGWEAAHAVAAARLAKNVHVPAATVRRPPRGFARAAACDGCPPLADLVERYAKAGGRLLVCPICMQARNVDPSGLAVNGEAGGTVPPWEWIGDDQVVTFSH
jgi:hypothetical protein